MLAECPKKVWLLSVVTKQDVWCREDVAARQFYAGPYADIVREVADRRGTKPFRHEVAFVSLTISNFVAADGERLRPNAEGYDQRLQVESVRRLFHAVGQLLVWEKEK